VLLGSFALMPFIAAGIFLYLSGAPTDQVVLVDEATQSVVITTQYRSGPQTERIAFADVVKLEHVAEGNTYKIVAVTTDAERKVIATSSSEPLYRLGDQYSKVMEKPLERTGANEEVKRLIPAKKD
jgi:hypothetical protein